MIPADHITIDGDTAWIIFNGGRPLTGDLPYWKSNDRPCDTQLCHGGFISTGMYQTECTACHGTGRHTFDIEVENRCWFHAAKLNENGHDDSGHCVCGEFPRTYRVSVVPGMVLPIVDEAAVIHGRVNMPAKCITSRHDAAHIHDSMTTPSRITLPPAAAPGMWAVLLRVAPENVEEPK